MPHDLDSPFRVNPLSFSDATGDLLLRLANLFRRRKATRFRGLGLTPAQAQLLRVLGNVRPGRERRVKELADAARLHPVLVTRLLGAFEHKGYAVRLADPADGRASRIQLTSAGRQAFERAFHRPKEPAADFFASLGGERPGFERLLRALLRANDPAHEQAPSVLARRAKARKAKEVT